MPTQKCKHYTLIFHTFVFMQIFNEINSRKLGEYEFNVFSGFFNNFLFIFIMIFTIVVQCVLVQYGGKPVKTCPLSYEEHAVCIGIGMVSLIMGVIVKLALPVRWFEKLHMKEEPMADDEADKAIVSQFRKSFR